MDVHKPQLLSPIAQGLGLEVSHYLPTTKKRPTIVRRFSFVR